VREYVTFTPQPLEVTLDGGELLRFPDPMIFTVAKPDTIWCGGAKIAPHAQADDRPARADRVAASGRGAGDHQPAAPLRRNVA